LFADQPHYALQPAVFPTLNSCKPGAKQVKGTLQPNLNEPIQDVDNNSDMRVKEIQVFQIEAKETVTEDWFTNVFSLY
jgi:hypothetical protein